MKLLSHQIVELFVLAIPIACIARTVVWEEIFREPREWCKQKSETCNSLAQRKFFYLFTCEYCFSHYVTLGALLMTRYQLLYEGWRGYIVAFFALVLVANSYLSLYARLRVDIASEKKAIEVKDREVLAKEREIDCLELQLEKKEKSTSKS